MVFVYNPRIQLAVAGGLEKPVLHSKYQASQDSTAIPCRKRENRRGEHICTTEQQQGPTEDLFP